MQGFIREGYITLSSALGHDYHDRMWAALDELEEGGPRGHNNLLPCVPELSQMLDEPVVRGALESILGPRYYLHFHRHDHFNFLNAAQPLHKDGDNHSHYAVDGLRRMHRTRFAMLFYYPQDTPLEKGPTGLVPRSHYVPRRALEAARARMNEFNKALRAQAVRKFGADVLGSEEARAWHRRQLEQYRADNGDQFAAMAALDEPWEAAKNSFARRRRDSQHRPLRHGARATQRERDGRVAAHGEVPLHPRPRPVERVLAARRLALASGRRSDGARVAVALGLASGGATEPSRGPECRA